MVIEQYTVTQPRRICGVSCATGDIVKLHPRQATFLLAEGVIEQPKLAKKSKAKSGKQSHDKD